MSENKYILGRGITPSTRLLAQHWLWKDHFDWNLHPSAAQLLSDSKTKGTSCKVADVGCGNGIWLIEECRSHPTASFIGLDVSGAQFPNRETLPINLEFRLWNFHEPPPSDLQGTLDVVHARLILGGIRNCDPVPVLDHLIQLLKPNGILQWDEIAAGDLPLKYPPGHSSDAFEKLSSRIVSKASSHMIVYDWVTKLGSIFQDRGLQLVEERRGGQYKEEMWKYWCQNQIGAAAEIVENRDLGWELLEPLVQDWNRGIYAAKEALIFVGRKERDQPGLTASTRASVSPCIACQPDESNSECISEARPCCDESCLETVARRQCTLQCSGRETTSCSSIQETRAAGEADSPAGSSLPTQTRKHKLEACSKHSRSVRERYATILAKVGCLCKELIAHNLEPCCKEGRHPSNRNTVNASRETRSSSILKKTAGGTNSVKGCCKSDECKGTPKQCERSGSEKKTACSTVKGGSYCCATENLDSAGINNSKCSCPENRTCCSILPVAERDKCGVSKGNDGYCGPKTSACSDVKQEKDCRLAEQEVTCSSTRMDKCCDSKENSPSAAEEDVCYGCIAPKVTAYSGKSCCTGVDKGKTSTKESGASYCGSGGPVLDGCSNDACCDSSGSSSGEEVSSFGKFPTKATDELDIEKGTIVLEHVILDVQGLTCVGCETKLFRSLRSVPGVSNLHTSLVLSQAEFDFDQNSGSVFEVIKSVEKTTGFACQRLNTDGQEVDVVANGDAKTFVERKYPNGVTQMIALDRHIVRITYDAKIIGARALLEGSFNSPITLAAPRGSSELESGKKHIQKTAWITLLSVILTIPVLVLAWGCLPPRPIAYGGVSLALATIVQFAVAGPFYPSALRALIFTHVIEMDLLIVLSTSTAYTFSVVSFVYQVLGHPLPTGEFFETSTLLVTLIMLGRLVSAFARQRAVESVSIRSLQAETAVLCDASGRGDREIDARLLQYGDFFKVMPDSRIPTDGVILSGTTEVDESMVTGESLLVAKSPGSSVIAGSLNRSGVIVVRLTHLPGYNTISIIAAMVDEAKFSKPKTQELVDNVASYFVPVILALTILTFAIWIIIDICVRHRDGGSAVVNALTYAISVLIVSCPCAIGLAVPMVVVIAGGVAARHGIVFKSAMVIETAPKVSHVVFDKTGTLTQGELLVVEEIYLSKKRDLAASVTLGLTSDSKHPVSAAIAAYLKIKNVNAAKIKDCKSVTGKGVEGTFGGRKVHCGNTRWLSAESIPEVQYLLAQGLTVFATAINDQPIAAFGLSDSLRPDSRSVITELQNRNIAVSIVSGDDIGAVNAIAAELGIPANNVRSRCTPGDKQEYLKTLMTHDKEVVVFCGDGTNDAVALAQADIGVHMNSGSDVAQTAADVVLVRPYLGGILVLLDLSKAAFHRILFNFAWSFVYNLFAILLAAGAFVHARIPPQYAGLGEIVSVLPVILIALQLRWFRRDY